MDPLEPPPGPLPPFFIVGSGRSGSTLLRRILCAHPALHVPPETYVLGSVIEYWEASGDRGASRAGGVLDLFEAHPEFETFEMSLGELRSRLSGASEMPLRDVLDAFYRSHARKSGKTPRAWGDKTPLNTFCLDAIRRHFGDARFVHIVRDGVDVAASYVQAGIYSTLSEASQRWVESVRRARDFASRHPASCLEIRYEDLVTTPRVVVESVCRFLEVPFLPEMLHSEAVAATLGDVPARPHHQRVFHRIDPARVGAGRKSVALRERERIAAVVDPTLRLLGYAAALD